MSSKAKNKSAAAASAAASATASATASASVTASSSSLSVAPLLILHPDNPSGNSYYRAALVKPRLKPFDELDATKEDGDVEEVKRSILSGKYPVILVCDLGENIQWCV